MKRSHSVILALALPLALHGQQPRAERVRWLQEHSVPIRSVAPADNDFADLEPVGKAIGDAQVVVLGEPSHGDGTTFLMKTRLIRYLHERKGFDVLAFESGFYDMPAVWSLLAAGGEPLATIRRGLFPIWARSEQVLPLLDYVGRQAAGPNPLELTGFDSQITGAISRQRWVADLAAVLGRAGIDTAAVPDWAAARAMLDTLVTPPGYALARPDSARAALLLRALDTLGARLSTARTADPTRAFWVQNLRSISAHARFTFTFEPKSMTPEVLNLRDRQMAENLLWLIRERYPRRKIIVWGASYHAMRNVGEIDVPMYQSLAIMGDLVHQALGSGMYTVGFVASEGMIGPWTGKPRPLAAPDSQSLEGLWASTTHAAAMLDFRRLPSDAGWLNDRLVAAPFGYAPMKAAWPKVFDAMIYTRVMEPSTRASR